MLVKIFLLYLNVKNEVYYIAACTKYVLPNIYKITRNSNITIQININNANNVIHPCIIKNRVFLPKFTRRPIWTLNMPLDPRFEA